MCVCVFAIYVKEVSTEKNCHFHSDDCLWRMCDVFMQWIHYYFCCCCCCCWMMICVSFDIVRNCVPIVCCCAVFCVLCFICVYERSLDSVHVCLCVPKSSYLYAFDCTLSFADSYHCVLMHTSSPTHTYDRPWKYCDRASKRMLWQVVFLTSGTARKFLKSQIQTFSLHISSSCVCTKNSVFYFFQFLSTQSMQIKCEIWYINNVKCVRFVCVRARVYMIELVCVICFVTRFHEQHSL